MKCLPKTIQDCGIDGVKVFAWQCFQQLFLLLDHQAHLCTAQVAVGDECLVVLTVVEVLHQLRDFRDLARINKMSAMTAVSLGAPSLGLRGTPHTCRWQSLKRDGLESVNPCFAGEAERPIQFNRLTTGTNICSFCVLPSNRYPPPSVSDTRDQPNAK